MRTEVKVSWRDKLGESGRAVGIPVEVKKVTSVCESDPVVLKLVKAFEKLTQGKAMRSRLRLTVIVLCHVEVHTFPNRQLGFRV